MSRRPTLALLAALLLLVASLAAAGGGGNGHAQSGESSDAEAFDNARVENAGPTSHMHHATVRIASEGGAHGKFYGRLAANADGSGATITIKGPFGKGQPAVLDWVAAAVNGGGSRTKMSVKFQASDLGGGDWRCAAVGYTPPELAGDSSTLSAEVIEVSLVKVSDEGGEGNTHCEIRAGAPGPQALLFGGSDRRSPFPAYYFEIEIKGIVYPFKSASGLKIEQAVVEIEEGGFNNHTTKKLHTYLINTTKLDHLAITRCLAAANSDWHDWFEEKGPNGPAVRPVALNYYDKQGSPVMSLNYADVAILDFQVDDTNENQVCETITLEPGGLSVT